jgi:RNA polymerase sigma-70 factor (ECF subfamily)
MHVVNAAVLERWSALSDEQVVVRILEGQTALFEVLMRRHNERLYRAARAILRDESEAEDVMQQAYVNAYAHLRQFDGRAAFSTWLTNNWRAS